MLSKIRLKNRTAIAGPMCISIDKSLLRLKRFQPRPEQVKAVAEVLATVRAPMTEAAIAAQFTGRGPWKRRIPELLETLAALGRARSVGNETWASA